ncbi:MAG TPA: O-antigen ligase family protein [Longimicrobiaceae bacterium]|nr:O-antigen ligase family protein [Longimicrobiaceae bacterium]
MSTAELYRPRETHFAAAFVALLGCGSVLAADGAVSGNTTMAIVGAGLAGAALMLLLCAGLVDGIALVVLCLAVPAPYASGSLRVAPAALATAAALVAWVVQRALDRREGAVDAIPWRAIAALFSVLLLSTAFALQVGPALREILDWFLLLALLAVAVHEFVVEPRRLRATALLIAGVMGVAGFFAALQGIGVLPARFHWRGYVNRATLGFGWPNELGMFMALGVPFSVHACVVAEGRGPRLLARLGLAANLLGLASSFSRGSWLSVAAALPVLLLCRERRFVLRGVLLALVVFVAVDVVSGGEIGQRIASTGGDWEVGQRLALTLAGLLMFRTHPLVGVGPGGFGANLQDFGPQIPALWNYTGSAQNLYVHMAAETGLLGLGALLVLMGAGFLAILRSARPGTGAPPRSLAERSLRRTLLWSFATTCFVGFFEWPFAHGVGELIILIAAMGFALQEEGAP